MIRKGANINSRDKYDNTLVHRAVRNNRLNVLKLLLDGGADINAKDEEGSTPLHEATFDRLNALKFLLSRGADVSARDNERNTPLHKAVTYNQLDMLKPLLDRGADINAKNAYGKTPLDIARSRGYSQIVEFLSSYQHGDRNRRDVVSDNSLMSSSIVHWIKGFISPKEPPALLTSRGHDNTTVTAVPEINTKSGNIQTGSKKSEKTSSATLLNVSHSGKSPVQGISKENVSNKGWSSSRRKVEGSTNFGAVLPKGASSTASSISQVYAQPDITGLMLLVPIFMNTMGRKFVLPLLSADQPISPEKAQVYALNIIKGFKEVLKQQAALKDGIKVHRLDIDFVKVEEEITGKIIGGKFNEISGILKSYAEKACPSREAGCSGRLSQKKFDKFMTEFNRRIDPVINQSMQQMLSRSEVSNVKEQQISLKPKSYLNGTSVQGHLTQDRDLKNQGKVLIS